MPLNLWSSIAGHEVRQLGVQHQVQIAHLIIVSGPSIHRPCLVAGVKHACGSEHVSGADGYVFFEGGEALGELGVVPAQLLGSVLAMFVCDALQVD